MIRLRAFFLRFSLSPEVVSRPSTQVCSRLALLDFQGLGQTELLWFGSIETGSAHLRKYVTPH